MAYLICNFLYSFCIVAIVCRRTFCFVWAFVWSFAGNWEQDSLNLALAIKADVSKLYDPGGTAQEISIECSWKQNIKDCVSTCNRWCRVAISSYIIWLVSKLWSFVIMPSGHLVS